MKRVLLSVYAIISLLLGILPFIVGFIFYSISIGFGAGMEIGEQVTNKLVEKKDIKNV